MRCVFDATESNKQADLGYAKEVTVMMFSRWEIHNLMLDCMSCWHSETALVDWKSDGLILLYLLGGFSICTVHAFNLSIHFACACKACQGPGIEPLQASAFLLQELISSCPIVYDFALSPLTGALMMICTARGNPIVTV